MKKQRMILVSAILAIILSVMGVAAQDGKKMSHDTMKKDGMDMMSEMKKSPHHSVMMAYKQNVLTFAKTLRDMSKGGKLADVDLARNAFAEIKHSMEKMEGIHQSHMSKMSAEMREKMTPMMEKMQAEKNAFKEHIIALDKAFESNSPDAISVEKNAAALVKKLEKSGMSDNEKKM